MLELKKPSLHLKRRFVDTEEDIILSGKHARMDLT